MTAVGSLESGNLVVYIPLHIIKLLLDGRLRLEIVNKIDAKTTKFLQRLIMKCC